MARLVPMEMPKVHGVREKAMVQLVLLEMPMVHGVQEQVMDQLVPMVMPTVHEVQAQEMVRCIWVVLLLFASEVPLVPPDLALMGWVSAPEVKG